ncbi:exopolysaccharide transport family protein [Aureliella helgolandensis]|uniref:Tyrosine-protein kinase YwqD n=1 Tax=Aureliella helgolandensis TaxID=2527968 RepID=A0A518GFD7_9BACT|nr:polysaccharide biosynthesis tyrosine autokinase [Aureliella helgolandensis]QDV27309.1 Tyrosine-protein kinase YwqD [Aureliella helgolandensis]
MVTDRVNGTNGQRTNAQQQIVVARPVKGGPEPSGPNLSAALGSLRRWWWIGLPLGVLLGVAGAVAGWLAMVPKYAASAYLRIDSDNRPLLFETVDQAGGGVSGFKLYKSTQQQIMLTPFVLNAALRDGELSSLPIIAQHDDPVSWLQEKLEVTFPGDGEVMQVTLETQSPADCVKIVNGVVDAYMKEVVGNERSQRRQRLESLEIVHAEAESKVRIKRAELKSLATLLGTGDAESLTVAQQNALQQYGLMQEKLSTIQFALMQAEGEMKLASEFDQRLRTQAAELAADSQSEEGGLVAAREPQSDVSESLLRTPDVLRLEDDIARIQSQLTVMRASVGPGHPSARALTVELEARQELLDKRREYAREAALESLAKTNAESMLPLGQQQSATNRTPLGALTQQDLISRASHIEVLKQQEALLQEKVDVLSDETRKLGQSSIDVELMRAEIAGLEDVLQHVGGEIERTSIELKTASRIKLLSSADRAIAPDLKKRFAVAGAGGGLGLLLPLVLLVGWDLTRRKVDNLEGVSHSLSLSTFGTVPMVDRDPLVSPGQAKKGRDYQRAVELAEAIDSVAAMVLHRAAVEKRQVFMVSSALAGEGKSTISCQLSRSLAKSGKRVLLVDFDLRRPSLHSYLELSEGPGVSELLHGSTKLTHAIQETTTRNLHVITAGGELCSVTECESDGSLAALLNKLRSHYDLVIIDTPPVLPVIDARVIGKYTDGVIFTLVRDRSRLPNAARACDLLKSYGIAVLGTVVIGGRSTGYQGYYAYQNRSVERKPKLIEN